MSYLIKEKFNIRDLIALKSSGYRVAILDDDEYLAGIYSAYLKKHSFEAHSCFNPTELNDFMDFVKPSALLLNHDCFPSAGHAAGAIIQARESHPKIFVVSIGYNTAGEDIGQLMAAGSAGHINRLHSRPQDIVEIMKALFLNN